MGKEPEGLPRHHAKRCPTKGLRPECRVISRVPSLLDVLGVEAQLREDQLGMPGRQGKGTATLWRRERFHDFRGNMGDGKRYGTQNERSLWVLEGRDKLGQARDGRRPLR